METTSINGQLTEIKLYKKQLKNQKNGKTYKDANGNISWKKYLEGKDFYEIDNPGDFVEFMIHNYEELAIWAADVWGYSVEDALGRLDNLICRLNQLRLYHNKGEKINFLALARETNGRSVERTYNKVFIDHDFEWGVGRILSYLRSASADKIRKTKNKDTDSSDFRAEGDFDSIFSREATLALQWIEVLQDYPRVWKQFQAEAEKFGDSMPDLILLVRKYYRKVQNM